MLERKTILRHGAQLEEKRRLEIERRVQEFQLDTLAISKRQDDLRKEIQERERGSEQLKSSTSVFTSSRLNASQSSPGLRTDRVGIYTKLDELSIETLRDIAEKQSLQEMTPLNTRGKYHVRFMKHAYPIAGSQLKLEKERDLILSAKKQLLLKTLPLSTVDVSAGSANELRRTQSRERDGIDRTPYRKLDLYVDQFSTTLRAYDHHIDSYRDERRMRLLHVQHQEGMEQFWQLIHFKQLHDALTWLKTHTFLDVNIPVTVREDHITHNCFVQMNKDVGLTPLMVACRLLSVELVRAILDQHGVVYLSTANGDTGLHFLWRDWPLNPSKTKNVGSAVEAITRAQRAVTIMQLLIDHNVDVNKQNIFGETALQHCACHGLQEGVQLLLVHGADVSLTDRHGHNAVYYAQKNGYDKIVCMLQTYNTIEKIRMEEDERRRVTTLLKEKRGALTSSWSESPDKLLARFAVEERRAGHLRNQYIDRHGQVIVANSIDIDNDSSIA